MVKMFTVLMVYVLLYAANQVKNGLNILVSKGGSVSDNRKVNRLGSTNGHQSGNVYQKDGLSPALCCTDYKSPVKILEEQSSSEVDKEIIEKNFSKVDENLFVTTDDEKKSCYAINTAQRGRPLHKKQDNYVLECIGSTQKHAARTDGSESPTLTEAMGKGGSHVPMVKLRESTSKGYKEAKVGDGVEIGRLGCTHRRGVSHEDSTGALNTGGGWGTVNKDFRIRKLTPVECERLQAFPDGWTEYGKDGELISDTQRYKCIGNAVTTTVITHIINEMFEGYDEED